MFIKWLSKPPLKGCIFILPKLKKNVHSCKTLFGDVSRGFIIISKAENNMNIPGGGEGDRDFSQTTDNRSGYFKVLPEEATHLSSHVEWFLLFYRSRKTWKTWMGHMMECNQMPMLAHGNFDACWIYRRWKYGWKLNPSALYLWSWTLTFC